jgi:hypothetical protein
MTNFNFRAPTLLEPDAIPNESEIIHDEPRETSERLAKIKKLVLWLKAELEKNGVATKGLVLDPSGWVFDIPCDEGFVMCIAENLDGDGTRITLVVAQMGGAPDGIGHVVEDLLRRSSKISELEVLR